jgi:hypothetical protein
MKMKICNFLIEIPLMNFLEQYIDIIIEQAILLDIDDLWSLCQCNKYLFDIWCNNKTIWVKKFQLDLPKITVDFDVLEDPKSYYLDLTTFTGEIYINDTKLSQTVDYKLAKERILINDCIVSNNKLFDKQTINNIISNYINRELDWVNNHIILYSNAKKDTGILKPAVLQVNNVIKFKHSNVPINQIDIFLYCTGYKNNNEEFCNNLINIHGIYNTPSFKRIFNEYIKSYNRQITRLLNNPVYPAINGLTSMDSQSIEIKKQNLIQNILQKFEFIYQNKYFDKYINKIFGFKHYCFFQDFQKKYIEAMNSDQVVTLEYVVESLIPKSERWAPKILASPDLDSYKQLNETKCAFDIRGSLIFVSTKH